MNNDPSNEHPIQPGSMIVGIIIFLRIFMCIVATLAVRSGLPNPE